MSADFCPFTDYKIYAQSLRRDSLPFLVAAMFTRNIENLAKRLKTSLERVGLNFVLYEVPTIHSSISAKGTSDIAFCKPNFIHFVHTEFHLPVLYVDADMIFRDSPQKIFQIARGNVDFASYNWLADAATDAYVPAAVVIDGISSKDRYYRFSHSVDLYDSTQLLASGATQYYSPDAEPLLRGWLDAISRFPQAADDEVLDYTFNLVVQKERIRTHWWTKDYCRYAWWINVQPIIDHPQNPGRASPVPFRSLAGRERFKPDTIQRRTPQGAFPRDCLIDTRKKRLLRLDPLRGVIEIGRFTDELWIGESRSA